MAIEVEKIMTLNHDGKKGVNILTSRYNAMKHAIITVLNQNGDTLLTNLSVLVEKQLNGTFDGKVGWYMMAVKLDLEVREIIERVPKKSPQTLRLVK